jgi:hypothetical protein
VRAGGRFTAGCRPAGGDVTGKLLIVLGLAIAFVGLLVTLGVPFGRLPGDVVVRRGSFTFYLPIATSIVVSLLLTLLFALLRR